jgi:hypothetical protein
VARRSRIGPPVAQKTHHIVCRDPSWVPRRVRSDCTSCRHRCTNFVTPPPNAHDVVDSARGRAAAAPLSHATSSREAHGSSGRRRASLIFPPTRCRVAGAQVSVIVFDVLVVATVVDELAPSFGSDLTGGGSQACRVVIIDLTGKEG